MALILATSNRSSPAPVANPETNRQTANYQPSIWGNAFIVSNTPEDEITLVHEEQQLEDLKEEVRRELMAAASNLSKQLKFIDAVQRLGVAYHFEKDIEEALQNTYDNYHCIDDINHDLYDVALRFRLLRQQGFNISCDIFNRYTDEKGRFKESLINDACGLLGLYEAAHLRVWEEDILDEALAFTTTHLKSMVEHLEYPLAAQVSHALYRPIRKGLERLEARPFMSIYQDEASHSKALLKLAKLDFNLLQSLYKKELSNILRWWKDLDFSSNLPFVRDRVVEGYFWIAIACFEPQYSYARRIQTKLHALLITTDDIFDAYGTLEELELYTEAIGRWDINSIHQLPEYMKPCYQAVLDFFKEIEMQNTERSYCVHHAQDAMKNLVQAFLVEAKWFHGKYIPTIEEYMRDALVSSGATVFAIISFIVMGEIATKEVFDWVQQNPKIVRALSTVMRLMNDMATHKFEQESGHIASSIECYMKQHGVSEQQAYEEFHKQLENAWKDINEECLRPTAVPMLLLSRLLNLCRAADVVYKGQKDAFTHLGEVMKNNISMLLIDPVPI
uniref:Trans-beta-farnesene synthase n=1 Tax=Vitis vinifera TaxID=29760 RepID=A0A482AL43_VITVI|nr:trans-beta-farnesene synthase [Vitis vinifera]